MRGWKKEKVVKLSRIPRIKATLPEPVELATPLSFHSTFNNDLELKALVAYTTKSFGKGKRKVGNMCTGFHFVEDHSLTYNMDYSNVLFEEASISSADALQAFEYVGAKDGIIRQAVIEKPISHPTEIASEFFEKHGVEGLYEIQESAGYHSQIAGIPSVNPTDIVSDGMCLYSPNNSNSDNFRKRNRGVLCTRAILTDLGAGKLVSLCDLEPNKKTYHSVLSNLGYRFHQDLLIPRRVSIEGSRLTGRLYWLEKHGGPLAIEIKE